MGVQLRKPRQQPPPEPDAWARGTSPSPESRPHYYVRHGLWRLRWVREAAPWLLIAIPVAAVAAVAALDGKNIIHGRLHDAKPKAANVERGPLKPRSSSRKSSGASSPSGGSPAAAGSSASSSASQAEAVSSVTSPLVARIHELRVQIVALLDGGLTSAERVQLWRLRLRLAIEFRRLIRAEIGALRAGGVTAAERARIDSLLAQLKKLDKRVKLLKKINRLLRGGLDAGERAKFDDLVSAFLDLKASAPLPTLASIGIEVRVVADASGGTTTTVGVAGVTPTVTGTTAGTLTTGATGSVTTDTTPGNSEFGHSHKKPKKPKHTTTAATTTTAP